jgi:hypothetical protein
MLFINRYYNIKINILAKEKRHIYFYYINLKSNILKSFIKLNILIITAKIIKLNF